jgi:hypothetical protein
MSEVMPAPDEGSKPAMVRTTGGGFTLAIYANLPYFERTYQDLENKLPLKY